jgi:UDP-N-acetylmuramoylalanine--D-glutamate ligase
MRPIPASLHGARVTVMGLGQFGGGLGVTKWLVAHGARVLLTDRDPAEKLTKPLAELEAHVASGAVALRLGAHEEQDFADADLVVANPAVPMPWDNRFLRAATAAGTPVTTEIRLAIDGLDRERTLGVTGSAGKSSTASMIALVLAGDGRKARLGGNIGGSLLGSPGEPGAWTVLELSSAMLWWLSEGAAMAGLPAWAPRVSVLTNLAPNHVDWHGTFADYVRSKAGIRSGQRPGDAFVSLFAEEQPTDAAAELEALLASIDMPEVPGEHQRRNARLAVLACEAAIRAEGATPDRAKLVARLAGFRSLPHRMEYVGTHRGMRCFNDSKSTTPDATLLAIASFPDPARIHLIAGGYDKKVDLSAIRELAPRLAGLYAIGATAPQIAPAAPALDCGTLDRAVQEAAARGRPGDVLLLSPACASWGQFTNYEHRGETFAALVKNL